jgi:methyl-accepting chemotaxis protein
LVLSFSALVIIDILLGIYALHLVGVLQWRVEDSNEWLDGIVQICGIETNANAVRRYDLNFMFSKSSRSEAEISGRDKARSEAETIIRTYADEVETLEYDAEEQREQDRVRIRAVGDAWQNYMTLSNKLIQLCEENKMEEAFSVNRQAVEDFNVFGEALQELLRYSEEGAAEGQRLSKEIYTQAWNTLIAVLCGITLVSILVVWLLTRNIKRSVNELLRVSRALQEGNLTISAREYANDEFGLLSRQYNQTTANIKELLSNIQLSAENLANKAKDLTRNMEKTASGTTTIVEDVETVSAEAKKQNTEVESLTSLLAKISEHFDAAKTSLDDAAQSAGGSVEKAKAGHGLVEKAVSQMTLIEEAVNMSGEIVTALGARSDEIGQIVATIAGLSSQTNLLALNAAIEAARAGAQGRGFAVVAEEVKKLAGASQIAAEKIAGLIASIQEETTKAVKAMEAGREEVHRGSEAVKESGGAFSDLAGISVESFERLRTMTGSMQNMAAEASNALSATRNIEAASREIAGNSQNMVTVTEEQAAASSAIFDAVNDLTVIADELLDATHRFLV